MVSVPERDNVTLYDLALGQARIEGRIDKAMGVVEQHEKRLALIDNPKDGALLDIRKQQTSQNRRVLFAIIVALSSILSVALGAIWSHGRDATKETEIARPAIKDSAHNLK